MPASPESLVEQGAHGVGGSAGCSSSSSGISGSRSPLRVADMTPPVGVSDMVVCRDRPSADGGDAAAAAQVRDDRVAEVGHGVEHRLHGQAVEAVAAQARAGQLARAAAVGGPRRAGCGGRRCRSRRRAPRRARRLRAASMLARSPGRCSGASATSPASRSRTVVGDDGGAVERSGRRAPPGARPRRAGRRGRSAARRAG